MLVRVQVNIYSLGELMTKQNLWRKGKKNGIFAPGLDMRLELPGNEDGLPETKAACGKNLHSLN